VKWKRRKGEMGEKEIRVEIEKQKKTRIKSLAVIAV
jgi:hypothetical protein